MSEIKQLKNKTRILVDDFNGVYDIKPPYTKLGINEFPVMDNYYMEKLNDMIIKRGGFIKFITALPHQDKAIVNVFEYITTEGVSYLMTKSDDDSSGKISYTIIVNPGVGIDLTAVSWTDITSSEETGREDFLTFKDRVFIANRNGGDAVNKIWDPTNGYVDAGCKPPDNISTLLVDLGTSTGSIAEGKYWYIVTWLYNGNEESGAMLYWNDDADSATIDFEPSIELVGADHSVSVSFDATGADNVTAVKIYRTKVDDSSTFYYLTTVSDIDSGVFIDTLADTDLGIAIDPVFLTDLKKPLKAKYQAIHKERLVLANLSESLYTPLDPDDIVVESWTTVGGLDLTSDYKYRFYKGWIINTGNAIPQIILSPYIEKTVTTLTTDTSVRISVTNTEGWHGLIFGQRTSGDVADDFKWISTQWAMGQKTLSSPVAYVDDVADGDRIDSFQDFIITGDITNFSSYVAFSDVSSPNVFSNFTIDNNGNVIPNSNLFKIGEDNGQVIVGIFSEYNRIVVFKDRSIHAISTSAQSKNFWVSNILHDKIGATERCILQLPDNNYFFAKIDDSNSSKGSIKFYLWDGQRYPQEVSQNLSTILNNNVTFEIHDMVYDDKKNWIYITFTNYQTNPYTLIYDLEVRNRSNQRVNAWYVWYNTELDLRGACKLNNYDVVFGSSSGAVMYNDTNESRDTAISGGVSSEYNITTKLQFKTLNLEDSDFDLSKFGLNIYSDDILSRDTLEFVYTHKIDNEAESEVGTLAVTESGISRLGLNLSGNCSFYYFYITCGGVVNHRILGFFLDIIPKYLDAGGK